MTEAGPVDLIDDDADDLDDVLPPPPEGECFCCLLGASLFWPEVALAFHYITTVT